MAARYDFSSASSSFKD